MEKIIIIEEPTNAPHPTQKKRAIDKSSQIQVIKNSGHSFANVEGTEINNYLNLN